ncbi:hypothetical protein OSB04_025735 [Centaurea solstitialis]|uniref:Uncharacterized protein n=1 Tax=Centaurea solstitialis TaxID=347529 RepID=A0AA38SP83_9ASTR|nr:hypothetical protein OSB04_025735 [Centaurea solstitialis]
MIPTTDKVANLKESDESMNCFQPHDSAIQGLGTPDSLLPPSEPPDINNWFSSYEYESFVLETNDDFGFSEHQESQGYKEEFIGGVVENSRDFITGGKDDGMKTTSSVCNQSEEDNKCENQVSDLPNSPVLSPEPPGIDKWFSSYAYESPTLDTMEDVILSDDKERKKESCISNNGKKKENDQSLDNSPTKKESPIGSIFGNVEIKVKEANGFVSVKRKRDENNELRASSSFVGVDKNHNNKKKDEKVRRKTLLGDITNIEMTGKWKCPQKGKPEIGPPLKQLRLGKWFHHV